MGRPQIDLASYTNDMPTTGMWTGASPEAQRQQAGAALREDAYKQSVAFVITDDGKKFDGTPATTAGTGFFVDKDGLLATDYHVIKNNKNGITVRTADGVEHKATIAKLDVKHDLALLQVAPVVSGETFVPIELASSSKDLKPTDDVITRGHPRRSQNSILASGSDNQTTSLDKINLEGGALPGEIKDRPMISTAMTVSSGDSGSPLIRKSDGKAVGIVDITIDGMNRAVSTPVEAINDAIAEVRASRQIAGLQPRYTIADISGKAPVPYSDLLLPQNVSSTQPQTDALTRWTSIRALPGSNWKR